MSLKYEPASEPLHISVDVLKLFGSGLLCPVGLVQRPKLVEELLLREHCSGAVFDLQMFLSASEWSNFAPRVASSGSRANEATADAACESGNNNIKRENELPIPTQEQF